ncbi:MAG: FAD-binding oxidoreductase, partial [Spirulina sp. DLM2.Bin59]
MTKNYDWIVIGGGITGAALAYELAKQGVKTLLLDPTPQPYQATRYSYGGLGYWAGTTPLTRQLCAEGIALHRQLAAELGGETEFRELPVLFTIPAATDPEAIAAEYRQFTDTLELLTPAAVAAAEPLLNPKALSGALRIPHAQINPIRTTAAYRAAFVRLGGTIRAEPVQAWERSGERLLGVTTQVAKSQATYQSGHITLCAGAWSRSLLRDLDLHLPIYFTHATGLELHGDPHLKFHHLIITALLQRSHLQANATDPDREAAWDQPGVEISPAILDPGIAQFPDGRILLGQGSHTLSDLDAPLDAQGEEAKIRGAIAPLCPILAEQPAQWFRC